MLGSMSVCRDLQVLPVSACGLTRPEVQRHAHYKLSGNCKWSASVNESVDGCPSLCVLPGSLFILIYMICIPFPDLHNWPGHGTLASLDPLWRDLTWRLASRGRQLTRVAAGCERPRKQLRAQWWEKKIVISCCAANGAYLRSSSSPVLVLSLRLGLAANISCHSAGEQADQQKR